MIILVKDLNDLPSVVNGVENLQIVETDGRRARAAEQKELILDGDHGHAGPGAGQLRVGVLNLGPGGEQSVEEENIVEALAAVPAAENVEVFFDNLQLFKKIAQRSCDWPGWAGGPARGFGPTHQCRCSRCGGR